MKPQRAGRRVGLAFVTVSSFGVASPAVAQLETTTASDDGARWGVVDAIGYGGLGFGLGLAATWDMEGSGFGPPGAALVAIGASTVLGTVAGAMIGARAQRAIVAQGELEGVHRAAVIAGAIMAGGTLGALAAVPLVNGEGAGTFLGSDEQTVTVLVLVGSALGSLYVWRHRGDFSSSRFSLAPVMSEGGEYGLRVGVTF